MKYLFTNYSVAILTMPRKLQTADGLIMPTSNYHVITKFVNWIFRLWTYLTPT
jgi:hypothetical protein